MRDRFGIFGTVTRFRELSLLLVMMLRIPNSVVGFDDQQLFLQIWRRRLDGSEKLGIGSTRSVPVHWRPGTRLVRS